MPGTNLILKNHGNYGMRMEGGLEVTLCLRVRSSGSNLGTIYLNGQT
jgi:hypothetical protein